MVTMDAARGVGVTYLTSKKFDKSNLISVVKESINKIVYKVFILSNDKKKYYYIWQIEKVAQGKNLKDYSMILNLYFQKFF